MKKILSLILVIIMCLSLISCDEKGSQSSSEEQSTDTSQAQSEESSKDPESESSTAPSTEDEDKAYLSIPRFRPAGYKRNHFAIKDSEYVITLELPQEWSLSKDSDTLYKIKRAGNEIGFITISEPTDSAEWSEVTSREKQIDQMTATESVEKHGTKNTLEFRYRWRYSYTENGKNHELNLYVTCAETPTLIGYKLMSLATIKPRRTDPNFGVLPAELDGKSMLVVGNSFVGTSDIGDILQNLFTVNGKSSTVHSISIGMGNIGKYAVDEQILSALRSGAYDVLFISGFYTNDDTYSLEVIKNVCDENGISVIVLPAHNENQASAERSASALNIPIINWKSELDELLSSGVDKLALCINDSYSHSTPLAGYVGAHMIYRAIYGEAPSNIGSYLSSLEISKLGDYARTGSFYSAKPSLINTLG